MMNVKLGGNQWVRVNGKENPKVENSNENFAKTDKSFQQACAKAGVEPTARQASKWRNKRGKAFAGARYS